MLSTNLLPSIDGLRRDMLDPLAERQVEVNHE